MKKKLFIAIYTTAIVLGVVLLNAVVTTIRRDPAVPPGPVEAADTSIAQFMERANSTRNNETRSRLSFLLEYFFPRTEALAEGCALRFSMVPERKAVEPNGSIRYDLTVSNHGKGVCENTSLSLYYTDKETFASSNPEPTASDYYWSAGNIEGGKLFKVSLTTKTTLPHGTQFLSEGCVTAENSPDVCAQTIIFVQSGASQQSSLRDRLRIPFVYAGMWEAFFKEREFGIWVWDSPAKMSPSYATEVISVARKNGFNVIYVTIDDYLEILDLPSRQQSERKEEYMRTLSIFVEAAQSRGIDVDVLGGGKDWAIRKNRWKGHELIAFVKEYNTKYPDAKVRGLQFDVEPYLLTEYTTDKQKVLEEFVEFADDAARRMQDVDAQLTLVIPHFYDSAQNWTPSFSYDGEDAHTFTHLLRVLKQKEDTAIVIMAYRNFFDEDNGTKMIAEAEIKEATEGGYGTKIIVAQETGNVTPAYVTFHDYPKVSLFDAITEIQDYFDQYANFGGTAVHYFDSFLKME